MRLISFICLTFAAVSSVSAISLKPKTFAKRSIYHRTRLLGATNSGDGSENESNLAIIGGAGVASNVVCDYSLYVLKTTGW
jgi:hypothetical protein